MKKKLSRGEVESLKEKTRKLSIKEGSSYALMDGFGLRYISPYALSLGANNRQIGWLHSLSVLLGNLSQWFTIKLLKRTTRKRVLIRGSFFQALLWSIIILIGAFYFLKKIDSNASSNLLIFAYCLIIILGGFISPSWNSLIRDNISKDNKGNYFARRNRITGIIALSAFLVGGFFLDYFAEISLFVGFAILFSIAMVSRFFSSYLFSKHYEPKLKMNQKDYFTFGDFLRRLPKSNFAKFSLFVGLIMLATSIASPFFSVYMLKELGLNYRLWTLIIVSSSVGSFLFMGLWGKFSDKHGNYISMKISGAFIPFIPILWIFSYIVFNNFGKTIMIIYLVSVELFSGMVWAGFNLSSFNYIYDAVSRKKLILCTIYSNILSGAGVFIGAILGGILSSMESLQILGSSILFVFLLSGILRFAVYFSFIKHIREVRKIRTKDQFEMRRFLMHKLFGSTHQHVKPRPMQ